MKVRFVGNRESGDAGKTCEMFGKVFVVGLDIDVSDLPAGQQNKLRANHHFEVVDGIVGTDPKWSDEEIAAVQALGPAAPTEINRIKRGPGRPRKVIADGGDDQNAE